MRLVVFDLDGTITRHDTLLPYVLGFLQRRSWRLLRLLRAVPTSLLFGLRLADHGQVKSALIQAAMRGCSRGEIETWTGKFVPGLLAHGVFGDALETIAVHARQGDRLVLMSASTDLYVPAVARELGFPEVICTGVRWNGEHLSGELTTPNRRGAEKVRCFESLRERHAGLATVAYGNARSDLPHLRLADEAVLVNGSVRARHEARRDGIACATWR